MLNEKHLAGIEARGLSVEVATRMGLYSGKRRLVSVDQGDDGVYDIVPDPTGNILCFPFFEYDKEVNTKYRWSRNGERQFMQRKGGDKTPFNANAFLNDENLVRLESESNPLIWTEGEFDCLAVIECGYDLCVSIPDGAMPGRNPKTKQLIPVPEGTDDIDPENDDKFAFFARHFERLMAIKMHLIAFDDDDSGRRMAKEIVRRIGAARCLRVIYPSDPVVPDKNGGKRSCKDMNEVLQHFGAEMVERTIKDARPWPVKGLYKLSDYPDEDMPETFETGISPEVDELFKFYPGAFIPITGIPGSGKSTLLNQMAVQLAKVHRWHICMFTGEEAVKPYVAQELMTAFLGKPKRLWTREDRLMAESFVERYFAFISHDPREESDEITLDYMLDKAGVSCFRYGTKLLIADPWNELEHSGKPGNMSTTEYTGEGIKKIKRFCRSYECATAVVAHPTKIPKLEKPGLYNISDSSHWANKADLSFIVHPPEGDLTSNLREFIMPKIRHSGMAGKRGSCWLDFDEDMQLFIPGKPPERDPLADPSQSKSGRASQKPNY